MKITQISAFLFCFGVCVCVCVRAQAYMCAFKNITATKQTTQELVFLSPPLVGTEYLENILGENLFFLTCTRYLMANIWWLWKVSLEPTWSNEKQAITIQLSLQLPDWDNQQFIV